MSYIALATTTLGSAASSVTFSSIPTSVNGVALRDLILICNTSNGTTGEIRLHMNGDTTGTTVRMFGSGSGSGLSDTATNRLEIGYLAARGVCIASIMDYSQTDKHKTVLSRWSDAANYVGANAARWANTNAINSVRVFTPAESFPSGSTFSLYGVA